MYYMSNQLTALAIIPGVLMLAYIYFKDKVEKEPVTLILVTVLLGAVSAEVAGQLEGLMLRYVLPQYPQGSLGYAVTIAFGCAALCEEIVKYLAMRIPTWNHKSFNYRFDGMVYGVCAGVGFAILENLMYVARGGLATAIVRAFTAIPLHSFCGMFMGMFYAYAKKASVVGQSGLCFRCKLLALLVPMAIHGTYDTLCFLPQTPPILGLFYIFVIGLYVVSIKTINKMSAEDHRAGFYPEARTINYDDRFTGNDNQ